MYDIVSARPRSGSKKRRARAKTQICAAEDVTNLLFALFKELLQPIFQAKYEEARSMKK